MAAARVPSFKIVIIGDSGVGKSSLLVRFVRNEFHEQTRSTISAAYLTRKIAVDGRTVQFEIWDTAGQERFRSLNTSMYYRGALGAIIVYDMTDPNSFQHARGWYGQLKTLGEAGVQVALVGNKADLEPRKVPEETAAEFASQNGLTHHVTSAKNGLNVEAVFEDLARRMPQDTAAPSADTVILLPNKGKSSCAC